VKSATPACDKDLVPILEFVEASKKRVTMSGNYGVSGITGPRRFLHMSGRKQKRFLCGAFENCGFQFYLGNRQNGDVLGSSTRRGCLRDQGALAGEQTFLFLMHPPIGAAG
jgi:hypothetical protein